MNCQKYQDLVQDYTDRVVSSGLSKAPDLSKSSEWFLAITGATSALIITNYNSLIDIFPLSYIKWILVFLFISFICGVWARNLLISSNVFFSITKEDDAYGQVQQFLENRVIEDNIEFDEAVFIKDFGIMVKNYVPFWAWWKINNEMKVGNSNRVQKVSKLMFNATLLNSLQQISLGIALLVALIAVFIKQ